MKYRYIFAITFVFILVVFFYNQFTKYNHKYSFVNNTSATNKEIRQFLRYPHQPQKIFKGEKKYSQANQDEVVYKILRKNNGFFIEMGAFNGLTYSNTLWLERMHNWTGLLIEANPALCKQIDKIKRNAWRLCACISTDRKATFITGNALGGVKKRIDSALMKFLKKEAEITVPCFTLDEVLGEINVHKIDYFSLDVEGAELFILSTMKKQLLEETIYVGVWTIEYRVYDGQHILYDKSIEKLKNIRFFFKDLPQYTEYIQLDITSRPKNLPDGHALDVVFVHVNLCKTFISSTNTTNCGI